MQYADVICDSEHYRKSHRLFNMQASVGAQRWLSLTEYRTAKCVYMVLLMLSGKGEGTDSNRYGVSCVVLHTGSVWRACVHRGIALRRPTWLLARHHRYEIQLSIGTYAHGQISVYIRAPSL